MPNIEIRKLEGEDTLELIPDLLYAFDNTPQMIDREMWKKRAATLQSTTVLGLYEDGKPVATVYGTQMTQNVRGKIVPHMGVAAVSGHPLSRRKGYVRQVINDLHRRFYEQGTPFAGLYPFRESFYGRLGYVTFPQYKLATFNVPDLRPLLKMELEGDFQITTNKDDYDGMIDGWEFYQKQVHGMAMFMREHPSRTQEGDHYWVLTARINDELLGMMMYRVTDERSLMKISNFFYTDLRGRYLLLEWIARHQDHFATAEIELPSTELPETWLIDAQPVVKADKVWKTPMGRVLDVMGLNGLPVGEGEFVAQVRDEYCPWNDGIFRFIGHNNQLTVEKTSASPACEIGVQAVGAWVYGTHDPAEYLYHGWGEIPTQTQAEMRRMFGRELPYMFERY